MTTFRNSHKVERSYQPQRFGAVHGQSTFNTVRGTYLQEKPAGGFSLTRIIIAVIIIALMLAAGGYNGP